MNALRQTIAILQVSLSELPQRIGPVLTIVVGVSCAVGVLVSMLAMGAGARRQETGDVRPDRAVLITSGARYGQSNIARDEAAAIIGLPGIAAAPPASRSSHSNRWSRSKVGGASPATASIFP